MKGHACATQRLAAWMRGARFKTGDTFTCPACGRVWTKRGPAFWEETSAVAPIDDLMATDPRAHHEK